MSENSAEVQEAPKYFERLNISAVGIERVKKLIKNTIKNTINCWNDGRDLEKQTFHIIGPAGVGKTEICKQITDELSEELSVRFDCMIIKAPVLSRDDYLIPYPVVDNGTRKFEMLYSDFVPSGDDTYGIYVIDECGRGDANFQQLMWQIQNEYKVHLRDLPKGWFVVAVDNPDDPEYMMDIVDDAAGLRRMLHVYAEVNAQDFLEYAIKMNFHPAVIEFIQAHPQHLYDFKSQKLGSVYANPASWERVSNILWGVDPNGDGSVKNHLLDVEDLAAGLVNTSMTRLFIDFLKNLTIINPKDVFFNYASVRKNVLEYVNNGNNAKLSELMVGFCTYLMSSKPDRTNKTDRNVVEFLTDIPVDTAAMFITETDKYDRNSEAFLYVTNIHLDLINRSKKYKNEFYDRIIEVAEKDKR